MTGHRSAGSGWGAALRIARRELLRAKGRTLLVLVMVLLPVAVVVGFDTLLRTSETSAAESLDAQLGSAQARVVPQYGPVLQSPDGQQSASSGSAPSVLTTAQVSAVLAPQADLLAVREARGELAARTQDRRTARVQGLGVDLRDPDLRGPFVVLRGSAPDAADEVAVTPAVERFGFPLGAAMDLPGGERRTVTGVVAPDAYGPSFAVLGLPESLGIAELPPSRFYVSGAEVTWDDVQQLNALGGLVLSRSVVLDPPPDDRVPELGAGFADAYGFAIGALIAVIAVLEVVLLAGPAFAVGARRQRRALALMAAGGAEPRHVRRVVLAQGLLVGAVVVVLAPPLGIGGAALLQPALTRYADATWGPFEVSVRDVVLVCLLGAGTALLAALVPALLAARQPVVAALQGRRTSSGSARRLTAVGLALLVVGVFACWQALGQGFPEFWVAASAVPTVLGTAALAPAALALAGRLAWRFPLPLRFAVRDAGRQRGRTAPAVAAVAAVVAGVVALGTAAGSDLRSTGTAPSGLPDVLGGAAVVTVYAPDADYARLADAARAALPGQDVRVVTGVQPSTSDSPVRSLSLQVCRGGEPSSNGCEGFSMDYSGQLGSPVLVGEQGLAALAPLLTGPDLTAARAALADGRALVAGAPSGADVEVRLVDLRYDETTGRESSRVAERVRLRAEPLPVRQFPAPAQAVLPESAVGPFGGARAVSLLVGSDLTQAEEDRLQSAVERVDSAASAYVPRPDEDADDVRLVVLLLGLGASVLVLGGSLAATSLALTEARPDLATMGQVGARPRTRRMVAASYGFVLALVGALLGCLAGLVPGIAGAVAVTRGQTPSASVGMLVQYGGDALAVVDVPWLLLLGLVVLLPLLTGLVAGLTVRSALPGLGRRVRA